MKVLFLISCFVISVNLNAQNQYKRAFSEGDYYYKFSISNSNKKIELKKEVSYYWYKLNKIHTSYYDVSGKLLNGNYQKEKRNTHELLEKGLFNNGIKDRIWKYWFLNGNLKKVESWKKGFLHGSFFKYEENGKLITKGNYKNGKKDGVWINYKTKDTLNYKKGILVKENESKKSFFKKIFKKKNTPVKKSDLKKGKKKTSTKKKKKETTFWYKLFHKKSN